MQRIADIVRTGHRNYVMGSIPASKAQALECKFQDRHNVRRNKLEASRARKSGLATNRLLYWWPGKGSDQFIWILLHQDGSVSDSTERWRDATKDRIVLTGYELVRITKPAEPKPVWTWRYSRVRHDELRQQIINAIRTRHDAELQNLINSIWRTPGFAGARDQVKKFKTLITSEWQRSRRKSEPAPTLPGHIGYVRRIEDKGLWCVELVPLIVNAALQRQKAALEGEAPVPRLTPLPEVVAGNEVE